MGRASKEQASKNRAAVVTAASRVLRDRGPDGMGVREVMAAAGLTQGAFARQFGSKEALAGEACAHAFAGAELAFSDLLGHGSDAPLRRLIEDYLAPGSADRACPMARLAGDAARTSEGSPLREAYVEGRNRLVQLVAGDPPRPDRLLLLAALVGGALLIEAGGEPEFARRLRAAIADYGEALDQDHVDGPSSRVAIMP